MSFLANSLAPDLIVYNGAITTFAADMPTCSAVAMKDGRVIAIGDDASVRALAGDGTREIDLRGRVAFPGFNDAHNHQLEIGLKLGRIGLVVGGVVDARVSHAPAQIDVAGDVAGRCPRASVVPDGDNQAGLHRDSGDGWQSGRVVRQRQV